MTAIASPRIKSFIGTLLDADATLVGLVGSINGGPKIYRNQAPQGTTVPYVIVAEIVPAIPVKALGNQTVSENSQFDIFAVTRGNDSAGVLAIAERLNDLLEGANGTSTGLEVFIVSGQGEIDGPYSQPDPGGQVSYWRLGRRWAVQSKAG
jgi:hypothetical protein